MVGPVFRLNQDEGRLSGVVHIFCTIRICQILKVGKSTAKDSELGGADFITSGYPLIIH